MDLEGLDSLALARLVQIECKRRAVQAPMTPPPAPTPRLQEADQARAVQAAWEAAGTRVGSKAGTCGPRSMWSCGT
jgi:hypothetical protein